MKVEFDLPDFKFHVGDVIERKNEHNDKSVFVCIVSSSMEGGWTINETLNSAGPSFLVQHGHYITSVQSDSYYDHIDKRLIRPGKCICFEKEKLEKYEKVQWNTRLVEADSPSNIDERRKNEESV